MKFENSEQLNNHIKKVNFTNNLDNSNFFAVLLFFKIYNILL